MKQLPYALVETAVNALQFCIVTRARTDANSDPVICCSPYIPSVHYGLIRTTLTDYGLYNDVIEDAIITSMAISHVWGRFSYPLVQSTSFVYTAQQYTDALQNLFRALAVTDSEE